MNSPMGQLATSGCMRVGQRAPKPVASQRCRCSGSLIPPHVCGVVHTVQLVWLLTQCVPVQTLVFVVVMVTMHVHSLLELPPLHANEIACSEGLACRIGWLHREWQGLHYRTLR